MGLQIKVLGGFVELSLVDLYVKSGEGSQAAYDLELLFTSTDNSLHA